MHGLSAKAGEEPQAHQIQQAVHKPAHAKLGHAVLALLVVHRFFANPGESGILGQVRDVAVHFAVHLDVFHHLGFVGFEAAVHVMELDAGNLAGRPVVQFGGDVLGKDIVHAVLLPAGHQVVAFFPNHANHLRNFLRRVLQVGVHRYHNVTFRRRKAFIKSGRFAVVAAETDAADGMPGRGRA